MTHSRHRSTRRRSKASSLNPVVGFMLVLCFGLLFAGCARPDALPVDEYTFTAEDLQEAAEIGNEQEAVLTGTKTTVTAPSTPIVPLNAEVVVTNPAVIEQYNSIRSPLAVADNSYVVTNEFLNVRSEPSTRAEQLATINQGEAINVTGYYNSAWAEVDLGEAGKGYAASRFIARLLAESAIESYEEEFTNQYFVDFDFLNVRAQPDQKSAKIGVLDGQTIIQPLDQSNGWARIAFDGQEGYIADEYIEPFKPLITVRQDQYTLPILHYRLIQEGMLAALSSHIDTLKANDFTFTTFDELATLMKNQQDADIRLEPSQVVIAISDVTKDDLTTLKDVLAAANVPATVFLQTRYLGVEGITETDVQNLVSGDIDVQGAGHIGDDLRSLTNAQVQVELTQSKAMLEKLTGSEVHTIAYPRGGVNDRIAAKAIEAGYLMGLSSEDGITFKREQLLDIPSIFISSSLSGDDILSMIQP